MVRYLFVKMITFVIVLSFLPQFAQNQELSLQGGSLKISFDKTCRITSLVNINSGKNYLLKNDTSYLLSVRINGKYLHPENVQKLHSRILLTFADNLIVDIFFRENEDYLSLKINKLTGKQAGDVELIVWGPYFTSISDTVGETVGVVRNKDFAIGIQSLNVKTMGGYPWYENDRMPEMDIFEQPDYNVYSKNKRYVLYRVEAAKPVKGGSSLQAYCRNRDKKRIISNLGYKKYIAPPWHDGGVVGSEIALFGCKPSEVLKIISEIEINEKLPHTLIDGEWAKTSEKAAGAYIIMDFSEKNIDEALEIVKKAGLKNLYHANIFKTWGHFELIKESFPNGKEGLKKCVEKADKVGITLGVHTLSNFITTNDAYVTPVPDKRLAKVGSSVLTKNVKENDTVLEILSPEFFRQYKKSNLKTVMLGEELIRFKKLSDTLPWRLSDCRRGAYETKISKHKAGDTVSLLADHAYKVFLTNAELTEDVAKNIADLFNKTGLTQISFDGLEGNLSTGLGVYGESLMPNTWYWNLTEKKRQNIIVHASRPTHFFWHIFTRLNWGEPWYAGFRESQTETRLKNQDYFKRNYIPGMLGWFSMREDMSLADMEWLLARSAAYDAGYAFVTSFKVLKKHGLSDKLLELIKQWEHARLSRAFPDSLKREMKNVKNEYHLEPLAKNSWNLYKVKSYFIKHLYRQHQPGEPVFTSAKIYNPYYRQQAFITVKVTDDTKCNNVSLEFDNYKVVNFPVTLQKGQLMTYDGKKIIVFDKNWNEIKRIDDFVPALILDKGMHTVNVDAGFDGGNEPSVKVEIRYISKPVLISSKRKTNTY